MAKFIIDTDLMAIEANKPVEINSASFIIQHLRAAHGGNKDLPSWLTPYKEKKKLLVDGSGAYSESFEAFWTVYPARDGVKQGKRPAFKSWAKEANRRKDEQEMLKLCLVALEWQKRTEDWKKEKGVFIPMACTYLNNERWTDEIPTDLPPAKVFTNMDGRKIEQ